VGSGGCGEDCGCDPDDDDDDDEVDVCRGNVDVLVLPVVMLLLLLMILRAFASACKSIACKSPLYLSVAAVIKRLRLESMSSSC
jgi:hypothetical protein